MKSNISFKAKTILATIFYIIVAGWGVYLSFYPAFTSNFKAMQTDPGDTRLVNYFLEHSFQFFFNSEYSGRLWSPTFFYPYKEALALSENVLGSSPIYWLSRFLFSPDIAFQAWTIIVSILNFFCFVIVLRRFKVSHFLSGLGGFLFAFNMPRVAKLGHQQLLPQFFTPLAFLALWSFVKNPTKKRLVLFLFLIYAQILAGIYLGWFLLFTIPICLGSIYFLNVQYRKNALLFWKNYKKGIIGILISWVALTALTLLPYIKAKFTFGGRSYGEIDAMLPRLASWFSAPPGSIWFPQFGWISEGLPLRGEHLMFSGLTVIVLTFVSLGILLKFDHILSEEQKLVAKVCIFVFIVIFCLSIRLPFGITLWKFVYWLVPGASVIRAVGRIWTIAYFYLFIGVFICWDSLLNTFILNKYVRLFVTTIILVLGIAEQRLYPLASYEKAPWLAEEQEIATLMNNDCTVAYVAMDTSRPSYANHLSAMWGGIKANVPVINGYSGNVPPGYEGFFNTMNTAEVINWLVAENRNEIEGNLCYITPKIIDSTKLIVNNSKSQKPTSNFNLDIVTLPVEKQFAQEIELIHFAPEQVLSTSVIQVAILINNMSNFLWTVEGDQPTNFSYRWLDAQGNLVIFEGDGDRTQLPWDVSPGETVALSAKIRTPPTPGAYTLLLTMVQENVAWFNDETDTALAVPVEIVAQ